ncbi:hypothetical protein [Gordonia terrae]|uniref:DODA-type extradiol aromatic ring-opening family dioxygenase n=1 Tax=Gordonia terrae TaxID=2055 RepID=UPI003F6A8FCE
MARLVHVCIVPHDPTLSRAFAAVEDGHPIFRRMLDNFERVRQSLHAAKPDVIVMASGDHFNQWFYDGVPAFAVGKSARTTGPFPWELEVYGLPPYATAGDHALGQHILEEGLARHFDLTASNEYQIDHGFTVPLTYVRPEQDIPVVPLWTNVLLPPLPPGRRYFDLGRTLRDVIEAYPADIRVAVIATGHMKNSVGGPAMLNYSKEPVTAWDLRTWELFTTGRVDDLLPECTWEQLYAHGNGTPGFMVHLVGWGVAGGRVPSWCELTSAPVTFAQAYLEWDEACLHEGDEE